MRLSETQGIIKYSGWYSLVKVLCLIWTEWMSFGFDEVKGLGDRNLLETINVFRFWAPKKLKLNWLAKRMGSDSFTIRGERI